MVTVPGRPALPAPGHLPAGCGPLGPRAGRGKAHQLPRRAPPAASARILGRAGDSPLASAGVRTGAGLLGRTSLRCDAPLPAAGSGPKVPAGGTIDRVEPELARLTLLIGE